MGTRASYVLTALVLIVCAAAFLVLQLLGDLTRRNALLLLAPTLVAGVAALLGWYRASQTIDAVTSLEAEKLDDVQADLESQLYEKQHSLEREHKAYKAEHDWNRELRRRIAGLQHERGVLGDTSDTRELVLEVAIDLLGAEKGLLISREDLDGDGDLDMVVAHGFQHDPEHSQVVQRFAQKVISSDETVREDSVSDGTSPADAEIENLVAIPIYIRDRFSGAVIACNKPGGFGDEEDEVLLALGDHAGAVLQNAQLHGLLRGSYLKTVAMLTDAVQAKDPFLRGHSDEVAKLVANVADRLGVEPERREQMLFGSLLHDVGKIGITERILLKPAALTPQEREVIEMHPRIGHRLVEQVPALRPIALGVLHHHERWDGKGYPSGLSSENIPLEARIIAVADTFSAMTSDRPYREKVSAEEACLELERCAGTQFDPDVVRAFVNEVRRTPEEARKLEEEESISGFEVGMDGEPLLGFGSYALVDNLTLLSSHRHLHEVAEAEARRASVRDRPFALMLCKLTDVDQINRERGYGEGDAAIQRAARIVEAAAGRSGGTAARYGGACIALLVPGASEEIVERIAEELTHDFADGPSARVVTSIWREGDGGEDVIDRALRRLQAAAPA